MRNEVSFRVMGQYALFTDPVSKIGGEKSTLLIPTYQSLIGVIESVYWKPSIVYYIDEVCVVKPIRTETKGIRPIKYGGGNDLAYYTYLYDVEYLVKAHFEFNKNRMDLCQDFNENKHFFVLKRSLEKGGRRTPYLGVSECGAYVEPCEFTNENSVYKETQEMSFGLQYHSLSYPDENGKDELWAKYWTPVMKNGIIKYARPQDCTREKFIKKMKMKVFDDSNFSGTKEPNILDGYKEGDNQ